MKFDYIEILGFRSYGPEPQRLTFESPLSILHAENSQGKTGLAEAIEFLFSGTISRRQLSGGSLGEFQGSLRNAHLASSDLVYVEAGLADQDSEVHALRRSLVNDFEGASDCTSTLVLDGIEIPDVTSAGLHLSDPPLEAPVLLEHALRYAVSAKPGERSDYFKAVLEVADLDLVRAEISAVIVEREQRRKPQTFLTVDEVQASGEFGATFTLGVARSLRDVELSLLATLNSLVPPEATEPAGVEPLTSARVRVAQELASRQGAVLPLGDSTSARDAAFDPPPILTTLAAIEATLPTYVLQVASVDRAVADALPLLKAALATPSLSDASDHPVDCPLCETPLAITPERIRAVRERVADREGLISIAEQIQATIDRALQELNGSDRWTASTLDRATAWSREDDGFTSTFEALGGDSSVIAIAQAAAQDVIRLAHDVRSAATSLKAALRALGIATRDYLSLEAINLASFESERANFAVATDGHRTALRALDAASARAAREVQPALAQRARTTGWQQILDLAENPVEVWESITRQRAFDGTTARLKRTQRAIDVAIREVLDNRLEVMADEIRKWWLLLRPDELTVFDSLSRRGAGNRYLDLTAALSPEPSAPGIVRNALAVLSNSQLNALGLATFLARCHLLNAPTVFLDDPVPGSDREHRYSFSASVVTALLEAGRQVVVTTHDPELARTLQTLHQHLGVDEYGAALLDPREGTRITRTGDDFERLLLDASSQMGSPLIENRRAAGNSLRIAVERLAKHILVRARRTDGEPEVSIATYDGKNLAYLRPLVIEHVVSANEAGQWAMFARILNDADHDAPPPQSAELKQVFHALKDIKKKHQISTS